MGHIAGGGIAGQRGRVLASLELCRSPLLDQHPQIVQLLAAYLRIRARLPRFLPGVGQCGDTGQGGVNGLKGTVSTLWLLAAYSRRNP
ncbi:hypothetical protein ACFCXG_40285 [Streptomyces sp. NPDC056295]|uniref:hypothetical protein n=1 Tax=Streptomyces sp. NPDC056295 TaxID=3345774 RepID=UPI0035E24D1E